MSYALVTGASKGIGCAIAIELASRKLNVLLVARREDLLAKLAAEIRKTYGVECDYLSVDLSRLEAAENIFNWCNEKNYTVNILVNNSGYGISGSFEKSTLQQQIEMVNVIVLSTLKLTHLFLPHLKKQPKAYILNIGSSSAYQAVPYLATYAAAKTFIVSFTRALKYELKNSNVMVTVVNPGVTETDFAIRANVPQKGLKTAEKVSILPEQVAKIAVKSMFKGKAEVVTGFITKATVLFVKLLPKKITERAAAKFYQ
jgi:short-subunit dehydrogenase